MNALSCQLATLAGSLLWIYTIVLFVYAVCSWIPELRGRWVGYLAAVVEPVLTPIRRVIPPIGGLDVAFLVLLLVLQLVLRPMLGSLANSVCYPGL